MIFVDGELYEGKVEYEIYEDENGPTGLIIGLWLDSNLVSSNQEVFFVDVNNKRLRRCSYMRVSLLGSDMIYWHVDCPASLAKC